MGDLGRLKALEEALLRKAAAVHQTWELLESGAVALGLEERPLALPGPICEREEIPQLEVRQGAFRKGKRGTSPSGQRPCPAGAGLPPSKGDSKALRATRGRMGAGDAREPRRCDVCLEVKGVTGFLRGETVCRKCGKERGTRAGAKAPKAKKGGDGTDGTDGTGERGRTSPSGQRPCHAGAGLPAEIGISATSKGDQGKDDRYVERGDGFMLTEAPLPPRKPPRPGTMNERGEFCMGVQMYQDHRRGQVEELYAAIRACCLAREHAEIRLLSPTGVFVESVTAEEIW